MADKQVMGIEELKGALGLREKASISDISGLIKDFVQKKRVERMSHVLDSEVDKICQMLFFGIRHTAFLNVKKQNLNYMAITYEELHISSLLEYTLINLSIRLSIDASSRQDLKEMITNLISKEIEIMKSEENKNAGV